MPVDHANDWVRTLNLDNLEPYERASAAWNDRHGLFTLTWTDPSVSGLQAFLPMVGARDDFLLNPLLRWRLIEDDKEIPLVFKIRVYRPERVTEKDEAGEFTLTAIAAWPVRNALAVEFQIENTSARARDIRIAFDYPGKNILPDWDWRGLYPRPPEGAHPWEWSHAPAHIVSIEGEPEGSWSTLITYFDHGEHIEWVRAHVAGLRAGDPVEIVCIADLSDRKLHLAAGETTKFTVTMGFGIYRWKARNAQAAAIRSLDAGWSPDDETERIRSLLKRAPALPPKYAGQPRCERMYAQALCSLNSIYARGDGGYIGEKHIPFPAKSFWTHAFFWDTAFTNIGACEFIPELCQESVEAFADNVTPRGSWPSTLCDGHRAGEGQAPVMAWSAWRTFEISGDKAWLERIYKPLVGIYRFWFRHHSSPRGLAMWYNGGQIADNDARFDPCFGGEERGNTNFTGLESPDINAFFVVELDRYARMADVLGKPDETVLWRRERDALAQKIVDLMYFPEHFMFFDVATGTRKIFSGCKGPNMFLPLWAEVPLPENEIRGVIEKHMLNPDEFYRPRPFPSLSFDDPKFDPLGYWRGRIWPHIGALMLEILWKYGYEKEAEQAADWFVELYARSPWLRENFAGAEIETRDGVPGQSWAAATVVRLLLQRYRTDQKNNA